MKKSRSWWVSLAIVAILLLVGVIGVTTYKERSKRARLIEEPGEAIYEEMVPPEKPMPLEEPEIVEAPPVVPAPPREPAPVKAPAVEERPGEVKVEEAAPPTKKPSLVMEKIDTDGDGIPDTYVIKGEPGAAPAPAKKAVKKEITTAGGKININTASAKELDTLPGIGPAKVQAIIDGRPYGSIEDLKEVKGIGKTLFEKMKKLITVD